MSLAATVLAASEGAHIVNELPIPAVAYGIIVGALFAVMGLVVFSFRDVANRHSEKAEAYAREHGGESQH
ncbi:hypothetical protein ICM05_08210 [Leucobacter sp. cx-42]|uniref:hypothetical protein n=1 Tax=unclassified Leucobacter TaxID=2621730 RepID=UPI00165D8E17|nr:MULTISPECIES: hypothetical protein [unclassified Leucobacter]MBC9954626.1 hypothetical protein [Leucobacter sp. cx-42]